MFFRKKRLEVRVVDDVDTCNSWREENGFVPIEGKTVPTRYPIYWDIVAENMVVISSKYIFGGMIAYRSAQTILRMAEHVVVTKTAKTK